MQFIFHLINSQVAILSFLPILTYRLYLSETASHRRNRAFVPFVAIGNGLYARRYFRSRWITSADHRVQFYIENLYCFFTLWLY